MSGDGIEVFVSGRKMGKTTAAVKWVLEGKKVRTYPFWSRVLITPNLRQADWIRKQWPELDYQQVYYLSEWQHRRRGTGTETEVVIDNLDMLLYQLIGFAPSKVTMTGKLWNENASRLD